MTEPSFELHPIFRDQPPEDSLIWRYLPLTDLIHILATKTIHFTRLDKFGDPFEGTWPKGDQEYWKSQNGFDVPAFTDGMRRTKAAACCWIECEYESAAMWDRYGYGRQGVGIKSRYGTLRATVTPQNIDDYLWLFGLGRVQYIDHLDIGLIGQLKPNEAVPNALAPFMLKNRSYDYEREVRVLAISNMSYDVPEIGLDIPIDPNKLIEEIVINPYADEWFHRVTEDIASKYGLTAKLSRSRLRPIP